MHQETTTCQQEFKEITIILLIISGSWNEYSQNLNGHFQYQIGGMYGNNYETWKAYQ